MLGRRFCKDFCSGSVTTHVEKKIFEGYSSILQNTVQHVTQLNSVLLSEGRQGLARRIVLAVHQMPNIQTLLVSNHHVTYARTY